MTTTGTGTSSDDATPTSPREPSTDLEGLLAAQRTAYRADPMPDRRARVHRLDRLHNSLVDHREALVRATNEDFGTRASAETELTEFFPVLEGIAYHRRRLVKWMKPERRRVPLTQWPATARVHYQPLGVVGIVVPWNFPILLALSPLVGALAAGNRAMIKVSEFAPRTAEVMCQLIAAAFAEDEVTVVTGGVGVARAFTALPFDHLVFTGSTQVGHQVMRAAAENLTPVTLELGGKSPAILHESFPVAEAARRLAFGKCVNAGQACVAPDYVLCPAGSVDAFCDAFEAAVQANYPTLKDNPDATGMISERAKERIERLLEDARAKGATLRTVTPGSESLEGTRKLPLTLVLGATDDMLVLQEELFGPILPVLPVASVDEAIAHVTERPRPLALYYFDHDRTRARDLLDRTHSGTAGVNETMTQVIFHDVPFGGIGPSGTGHYHDREGFRAMSHARTVIRKGRLHVLTMVGPPWGGRLHRLVTSLLTFRFRKRKVDGKR